MRNEPVPPQAEPAALPTEILILRNALAQLHLVYAERLLRESLASADEMNAMEVRDAESSREQGGTYEVDPKITEERERMERTRAALEKLDGHFAGRMRR